MMEAYGRNKYTSTGVIQWMLNNAWPSMIWHIYDWYLRPGGSYFGVKKACEPLHVQYSYDDHSIVVVNSYYQPFSGLIVTAKVYNVDMTQKFSKEAEISVGPDSSTRVFTLPPVEGLSTTYFVSLTSQSEGQIRSRNLYWLSTRPKPSTGVHKKKIQLASTTSRLGRPPKLLPTTARLNTLPKVDLNVSAQTHLDGEEGLTTVTLHNPTSTLAFAVHLKVNKASNGRVSREGEADKEILPVLWQDNYFALLPGETRQVTATYRISDKKRRLQASKSTDGMSIARLLMFQQ